MKTTKEILTIIGNLLLAVLILVGIVVGVSMLPIENNYKMLSVKSGSMASAIPLGSIVVIKPANNYEVGDAITFPTVNAKKGNDFTTHRIESIENKDDSIFYKTKGDANQSADSDRINKEDVIGKVYIVIPWVGYLLGYIKTLPGLVLIIVIPSTIIIYEEIRKLNHETRKIIQKRKNRNAEKQLSDDKISPKIKTPAKKQNSKGDVKNGHKKN